MCVFCHNKLLTGVREISKELIGDLNTSIWITHNEIIIFVSFSKYA